MNISTVNYAGIENNIARPSDSPIAPANPEEIPEITPNIEESGGQITDTVELSEEGTAASGSTRAKGVLLRLQEGHFKGVADIRLRMNFHEEISAMENEKSALIAQAGIEDISGTIGSKIEESLQFEGQDESVLAGITEAHDNFNASLAGITENISSANSLVDQLKTAFG